MSALLTCPDRDSLQALLEGALPDVEQISLHEHQEHCPTCQHRLERLAAG